MTDYTVKRAENWKELATKTFGSNLSGAAEVVREFAYAFANSETESSLVWKPQFEDWKEMARGILYLADQMNSLSKEPSWRKTETKVVRRTPWVR